MDNIYKREIQKLIREKMLSDTVVNSTVRMLADAYLDDMDNITDDFLENVLNKHFDELMLKLFKVYFNLYNETKDALVEIHQKGLPPQIIITTQEHCDAILKENNHYKKLREEVNRYDLIEKDNKELYEKLRTENKC